MENVFIDPNMLSLQTEEEVVNNINFFRDIIMLVNSKSISICVYIDVLNQISNRELIPFPIKISEITDRHLKDILLQLNATFNRSIMNNFFVIDIDACEGEQNFKIDKDYLNCIEEYYDFFCVLLTSCYKKNHISDKILVGENVRGIKQREKIELLCECEKSKYKRTFTWISPKDFLSDKDKALEMIRVIVKDSKEIFVNSPQVTKGQHHNHIQSTDFNCYEELSAKNKRVFRYLRYLGLSKIIFANFSPDTSSESGSIKIVSVEETRECDIVEGWFFGCVDFRIWVKLIFPKGLGIALEKYSDGILLRRSMEELVTTLGIYC